MQFKAKIFKLGNSVAMYIPKCIYIQLKIGNVYTLDVRTDSVTDKPDSVTKEKIITKKVYTSIPVFCEKKHKGRGVNARRCGCYVDKTSKE